MYAALCDPLSLKKFTAAFVFAWFYGVKGYLQQPLVD